MRAKLYLNEVTFIDTMITKTISPHIEDGQDDDRLAAEVRQDRPGAFLAIYDRYLTPVYRYLYRRVGDIQTAEDLTTQVFITALERFSQYRGGGKFAAWLFTIARNKSIDYFRKSKRELPLHSCSSQILVDENRMGACEEAMIIQEVIANLKPDERELLDMRFAAEMSFVEMSQVLHRNESTVKKQFYRLLERVRKELEESL
jgi:RNA polymerase sigma factor (sigma-70 family)